MAWWGFWDKEWNAWVRFLVYPATKTLGQIPVDYPKRSKPFNRLKISGSMPARHASDRAADILFGIAEFHRSLGAGVHMEFLVNPAQMDPNSLHADVESVRDLLVGEAFC